MQPILSQIVPPVSILRQGEICTAKRLKAAAEGAEKSAGPIWNAISAGIPLMSTSWIIPPRTNTNLLAVTLNAMLYPKNCTKAHHPAKSLSQPPGTP